MLQGPTLAEMRPTQHRLQVTLCYRDEKRQRFSRASFGGSQHISPLVQQQDELRFGEIAKPSITSKARASASA